MTHAFKLIPVKKNLESECIRNDLDELRPGNSYQRYIANNFDYTTTSNTSNDKLGREL